MQNQHRFIVAIAALVLSLAPTLTYCDPKIELIQFIKSGAKFIAGCASVEAVLTLSNGKIDRAYESIERKIGENTMAGINTVSSPSCLYYIWRNYNARPYTCGILYPIAAITGYCAILHIHDQLKNYRIKMPAEQNKSEN